MSCYRLDMFEPFAECSSCPLNNSKKVSTYFTNDNKCDVLIIGQSPGMNEVLQDRPFIGRSGDLINKVINNYTDNVTYINIMSCRPVDESGNRDRAPATAELRCCRKRFVADFKHVIDVYDPKVVVVLGKSARQETNRILKTVTLSQPVHFLDHPAYILRKSHLLKSYNSSLHEIMKSVFHSSVNDELCSKFVNYDMVWVNNNVLVSDNSSRDKFINDVYSSHNIGVDIETNMLDMFDDNFIIGTMAVSCDEFTYFFKFKKESNYRFPDELIEVLGDDKVEKIFADILFDVVALKVKGIDVRNYTDLMPVAFLHNNTYNNYDLESITMRYMPEYASYKSKFKSTLDDNKYLEAPLEELMTYNCLDSLTTKMCYNKIYNDLPDSSVKVFDKITKRLLPVLVDIKMNGMKIDVDMLNMYKSVFESRKVELSKYFLDKYGITKLNSTPQIRKWLFEDLKIKPLKFTNNEKTTPSTDKKALELYVHKVPDVKLLYEERRITNLLTYFIPSIERSVHDGVVHPQYKHYGIQSYRLSCKSPNLQGIPRDSTGIDVLDKNPLRRLFISRRFDSYIVEYDYSQQEVRIIADLSGDDNMRKAFVEGKDIHRFVASIVFAKKEDEISKFERQIAKGCVFGAIFGVSARELAMDLHVPEREAQGYLNIFSNRFPKVIRYINNTGRITAEKGVILSVFGKPRKFNIYRDNVLDCKREGANHTIQSPGADFTYMSLIRARDKFIKDGTYNNGVMFIHTVHDSIITEVSSQYLKYSMDIMMNIMSDVPKTTGFKIPFEVDYKIGRRWGENLTIEEVLNGEVK